MIKRFFVIAFVLIIVEIVAIPVGISFIDWDSYKGRIEREVKNQTNLNLKLAGALRIGVLPFPHVIVENISVSSDEKGRYETLMTLKRVEVGLALFSLLQGKFFVSSLELLEPKVSFETKTNGKILGIDRIFTSAPVMEGSDKQVDFEKKSELNSGFFVPSVAFDSIRIIDAKFIYYDEKTREEQIVDEVSGDFSVSSILGSYKGKGSFKYQEKVLNFDFDTKELIQESLVLPIYLKIGLQPENINAIFEGALNFKGPQYVQGNINIGVEDLSKALVANNLSRPRVDISGKAILKGFLSAEKSKLTVKQLSGDLLGSALSGAMEMLFEPFALNASLKTDKAIDIQRFIPEFKAFKTASFDLVLVGAAEKISISKGSIVLDDQGYQVSGAYVFGNKTNRPEMDIKFSGDVFDLSVFDLEKKDKAKAESIVKTNSSSGKLNQSVIFSLPLDLRFDVELNKIFYAGRELKKVKVSGFLRENSISLSNLSVADYLNASVVASGEVKDINNLSGIKLVSTIGAADFLNFLSSIGVDVSSLPAGLRQAEVKIMATGSVGQLDTILNVKVAKKGEVVAKGIVSNLLDKPLMDHITVQIKHQNMDEAIGLFYKTKGANSQFQKPLDIYAEIKRNDDGSYQVSDLNGNLSGITVQGNAVLKFEKDKPEIKGELDFGNAVLMRGGASSSLSKASVGKRKKGGVSDKEEVIPQKWSKEPLDFSAFNALNAEFSLRAKTLVYGSWSVFEPQMNIALNDGVLSIKNMQGGLLGGQLKAEAMVETAPQSRQPMHISLLAKADNVDLGGLLKTMTGNEILKISGRGNADFDLKTSGLSEAALIYDLSGKGIITGSDIVLQNVDVERFAQALSEDSKPGDSVLALWKGVSKGGSTAFDTLDGAFDLTEGIATISKMDLDGPQASILTTGKVDLPKWMISTKHKLTAKTRKDVPSFEMSFSGPLDNPAQTFGQGILDDYIQRKVQRKINKLIGGKLGEKLGLPVENLQNKQQEADTNAVPVDGMENNSDNRENSNEELDPEDAIKDVLKGILQ